MSERVLFFSPHAGIWMHAFPEALVADAVRRAGAEVRYVTCDGALASFCIVMAAHGLQAESAEREKLRICSACRTNRDWIRHGLGLPGYDLDRVLSSADERRIESLLGTADPSAIARFAVDGINVGRIALYEYLIQKKKSVVTLDAEEWQGFRPLLANVLRSMIVAQRTFDTERPTRLVVYNSLYSVNAAWRAVANLKSVPVYFVHAGPSLARRPSTLMLARDSTTLAMYRLVASWPQHQDVPCHGDELSLVSDHFCEVLRGRNVFSYSAPKAARESDWRARFGIRDEQKLLVATMSSYDEYVAARAVGEQPDETTLLFETQIAWIRALIDWVTGQQDRFLLIRVHPREFPNKREGRKSEHAARLEGALTQLPENVRVNWPTDKLSLYDIAEHADVILNAWSSVGKEMPLLGRPVVVYCPSLLMYAPALNYVGETRDAYFAQIENALRDGWSFERIRATYRWCVVEYVRSIADISDGFDFSEAQATTNLGRARNLILAVPGLRQQRDLWRRPRVLDAQARLAEVILSGASSLLDVPARRRVAATEAEETAALRTELRRLLLALYPNASGAARPGSLRAHLTAACA